jgi:hypothetical protein
MQLRTEAIYHCEPGLYLEQYFDEKGRSERFSACSRPRDSRFNGSAKEAMHDIRL